MQSLKMLKTFGLLLVLLVSATSVKASDINLGPFQGNTSGVFDLGTLSVGNTYSFNSLVLGQGSFSQTFNFDFAGPGSLGISLMPRFSDGDFLNGDSLSHTLNSNSLVVSGNSTGIFGFGYSVQIAAVPEPEEWAMLLAGLCLVGLKFSRIRREDEASAKLDVSLA